MVARRRHNSTQCVLVGSKDDSRGSKDDETPTSISGEAHTSHAQMQDATHRKTEPLGQKAGRISLT
jgi:hypothetical protein